MTRTLLCSSSKMLLPKTMLELTKNTHAQSVTAYLLIPWSANVGSVTVHLVLITGFAEKSHVHHVGLKRNSKNLHEDLSIC